MLRILIQRQINYFSKFNVEKFTRKDYETICFLLKEKFPVFNEAIEIHTDVKLIDEKGKFIGRYEASQARKKAQNLKKDLVLINKSSVPAICKVISFRQNILNTFYDQVVIKRNQQLIKKASSTKQLKISLNLTDNDLTIKARQIVELAKKNQNVRVFISCKESQVQESKAKFDTLKALLQNKCIIEKDPTVSGHDQEQDDQDLKYNKKTEESKKTVFMLIKSKSNQFLQLLVESSDKEPASAIEIFLKRFYRQQDVDMMDLKQKSLTDQNKFVSTNFQEANESSKPNQKNQKKSKQQQLLQQTSTELENMLIRSKLDTPDDIKREIIARDQGKSRILTQRLRKILEVDLN